jgi:hypothetical protein
MDTFTDIESCGSPWHALGDTVRWTLGEIASLTERSVDEVGVVVHLRGAFLEGDRGLGC